LPTSADPDVSCHVVQTHHHHHRNDDDDKNSFCSIRPHHSDNEETTLDELIEKQEISLSDHAAAAWCSRFQCQAIGKQLKVIRNDASCSVLLCSFYSFRDISNSRAPMTT